MAIFAPAGADEGRPKWELGLGLSALNFPAYRGADERVTKVLPIPFFIYRSEHLQVDGGKVQWRLFSSDRTRLRFSVSGSIPVDSDDTDARDGMPDLDPTLEIGPSLAIELGQAAGAQWNTIVPVRAVIATDFSDTKHVGWLTHPQLTARWQHAVGQWPLNFSLGPLFADKTYHEYFYGVAPQYATAQRPAYSTDGGYSGTALILSTARRIDKFWLGGFIRYDYLNGATFDDSPLVKQDYSLMAGFAMAWIFAQSSKTVKIPLEP